MSREHWNLVHKEWRDRRSSFLLCCGWLVICAGYSVASEVAFRFRMPVASFYSCCLTYSLFAAVFLASKTALSEMTHGTLNFSLALPLSRKSLAWLRLIGGIGTLLVPIVVGALLVTPVLISGAIEQVPRRPILHLGQFENRDSLSAIGAVGMLWSLVVVAMFQSTALFLILAVFGARRRFESHIGFFGAVMALIWAFLTGGRQLFDLDFRNSYGGWLGALFPHSLVINYGYETEIGSYTNLDIGNPFWLPLLVNLLLLSQLCVWFVSRYATRAQFEATSTSRWCQPLPSLLSRVPNVLPGRWGALVWMNLRQAVPLATAGLLLAILLAVMQILSQNDFSGFMFADEVLRHNIWIVATLWATIVASGIFAADLRPGLASFWRSRPLSVNQWFWTKWIVGLIAVLGVLDGVTIAVSWGTPIEHTRGLSLSYIATMVPLHAMMYSLSAFGVCWLRRPVAGAMLAVIAFFFGSTGIKAIFGPRFEPIHVHNAMISDEISGRLNLSANAYPCVYGTIIVLTIVAAIAAARSIRHLESATLWYLTKGGFQIVRSGCTMTSAQFTPKRHWLWSVAAPLFILIIVVILKQRGEVRESSSPNSQAVSAEPSALSDPRQLLESLLADKSLTHLKHLLSTNGVADDQIDQLKRVGTLINYSHSDSASEIVADVKQISLGSDRSVIVAVALAHLDFEQPVGGFAHPGIDCDRAFVFDEDGRLLKQVGDTVARGPTMEMITVLHLGTQHSWFILRDTAAESAAAPFTIKTEVYRLIDDFPKVLTFYHHNGDTMITHKPEHFGNDGPGIRFSRGPLNIDPGTLAIGEDGRTYPLRLIWNPETGAFEGLATLKVDGKAVYQVDVLQSPGFSQLDKL